MAKKNKKSKKTAPQEKPKPLVTMADLQAMSDSDDDSALPPEEEWDADAKALKKAIEEGAFDKAMKEYQEGKNNGDDDESIEEVELGDDGSEDDDDEAEKVDADSAEEDEEEEASSEDEKAVEEKIDDDDNEEDSEEEESEDEHDDSKAKASSKPQHKKNVDQSKQEEDESDSEAEEEKNDSEAEEDSDKEEGKEDPDAMNTKALRVVTQGLAAFRRSMPWAESFTVTPPTTSPFAPGAESSLDIHDDLKREVAFYDIALEAALEARKKCQQAKIPFSRPDDFFAEMVKTDGKLLVVWEYCRIRSN